MKKYLIEAIEREKTALDALSAMSLQAAYHTHLRAHETKANLVCRILLEKKKKKKK